MDFYDTRDLIYDTCSRLSICISIEMDRLKLFKKISTKERYLRSKPIASILLLMK